MKIFRFIEKVRSKFRINCFWDFCYYFKFIILDYIDCDGYETI